MRKSPWNYSSHCSFFFLKNDGLIELAGSLRLVFLFLHRKAALKNSFRMLIAALTSRFQKLRLQPLLRQRFTLKQFLFWSSSSWHSEQPFEVLYSLTSTTMAEVIKCLIHVLLMTGGKPWRVMRNE